LGRDDSRGTDGRAIRAPADGEVILAGDDFYYEGNCVFLAHGGGVITGYYHMAAAPTVKTGEKVSQGHKLGEMGATGSANGIHLCWRAQINGIPIDPETLM